MADPSMKSTGPISIYPVGLLHDWQLFIHAVDRAEARARFRHALGHPLQHLRSRNWRALRSYFNGYLAEHPSEGDRAGHGWTRGRAVRDLAGHLGCGYRELT